MKIDSPRLGLLEVDSGKIIEFPRGIPGFEHCKRFALFHEEGSEPVVYTLQSLDDPEVALPITDPAQLGFRYELTLEDDDVRALRLGSREDAAVAVVLRRNDDVQMRRAGDPRLSANLTAPLVINMRERRGVQQIIARMGCELTFRPIQ